MPRLHGLIGELVGAHIPSFNNEKILQIKIRDVDAGGLWIESQDVINSVLEKLNVPAIELTPVMFLPFHQIGFLLLLEKSPSLSEKSFGAK